MEIWPVIHLHNLDLTHRNAALAVENGVDGVFLIHMSGQDEQVLPTALFLKEKFPELKMGANFLSMRAVDAVRAARQIGLDATWSDSPGIRSDRMGAEVDALEEEVRTQGPGLFFASVAFKYQPEDADPGLAALRAWARGFIPTTSGPATGQAPTVQKLAAIRKTLSAHNPRASLALASGADPDNIIELAPFLSHVLVSTGISSSDVAFDPTKLRRFVEAARAT